jgi:hypothetical protein
MFSLNFIPLRGRGEGGRVKALDWCYWCYCCCWVFELAFIGFVLVVIGFHWCFIGSQSFSLVFICCGLVLMCCHWFPLVFNRFHEMYNGSHCCSLIFNGHQ